MESLDEISKKQNDALSKFLEAQKSGSLPEFLQYVLKQLEEVKSQLDSIPEVPLDEGKTIKEYDYYKGVKKEFLDIYKKLNKNNILNAFSSGPKINLDNIKTLDGAIKPEEVKKTLNSIGLKLNGNLNEHTEPALFNNFIRTEAERLKSDQSLNRKVNKLFIVRLYDTLAFITEYSNISSNIQKLKDQFPEIYTFTVQLLYIKAYETNLDILKDAYTNMTGRTRRDFEKDKEYNEDFKKFRSNHQILNEAMDYKLRNAIAHNIYKDLNCYSEEIILEKARRNFITCITGIAVKTHKLISDFNENLDKLSIIFNKAIDNPVLPLEPNTIDILEFLEKEGILPGDNDLHIEG
ncbi:MAG: hypothetical protein QXP36_10970 [Conexivisphaerales archaeon]